MIRQKKILSTPISDPRLDSTHVIHMTDLTPQTSTPKPIILSDDTEAYLALLDTCCGGKGRISLINGLSQPVIGLAQLISWPFTKLGCLAELWGASGSKSRYMIRYCVQKTSNTFLAVGEFLGFTWRFTFPLMDRPGPIGDITKATLGAIFAGQFVYIGFKTAQQGTDTLYCGFPSKGVLRVSPSTSMTEHMTVSLTGNDPRSSAARELFNLLDGTPESWFDTLENSWVGAIANGFAGKSLRFFSYLTTCVPGLGDHLKLKYILDEFIRRSDHQLFGRTALDLKSEALDRLVSLHQSTSSTTIRTAIETLFTKIIKKKDIFFPDPKDSLSTPLLGQQSSAIDNRNRIRSGFNYIVQVRNNMSGLQQASFDFEVGVRSKTGSAFYQPLLALVKTYLTAYKSYALWNTGAAVKLFIFPILNLVLYLFLWCLGSGRSYDPTAPPSFEG